MPKLTVLLPVRNGAETVLKAVKSTLRDLPSDGQITVLDDGSSDGTRALLDTVLDPRLEVLESKGSGGLGNALNILLDATDSQYIARMDADDITLPGRFRQSMLALERGNDFVFTSAVTFHGRRARLSWPAPIAPDAFPLHLLLSNPVRHPTLCARRDSVERVGGYRQVTSEDYDLWLRAAVADLRICKVPWYGLAYRVHDSQITANPDWRKRSHADPSLNSSFAHLSSRLLGREHPRLVSLEGAPNPSALSAFVMDFETALTQLAPPSRLDLRRKLRRRIAQITETWTADHNGGT